MNLPEDTAMMRKNLDKSNIVFSYPEYINPSKAGLFESIFSGGSGGGGGGGGGGGVSVCVLEGRSI